MSEIRSKHRQHYVFQAYLRNWADDNQIWCCRERKNIFLTNTINVAQERDFYRINDINCEEERFLMLFLQNKPREIADIMARLIQIYKKIPFWKRLVEALTLGLQTSIYANRPMPQEVEQLLEEAKRFTEAAVNDFVEDIFSDEEAIASGMLSQLKDHNVDFYVQPKPLCGSSFDNSKRFFLYFVCAQHYRTKAALKRWAMGFSNLDENICKGLGIQKALIRPEHLAYHIFWFMEGLISDRLYQDNAHLTLLINETDCPFITSDQPVINLFANYNDVNDEPKELVYYYPISPQLAITINDKNLEDRIHISAAQAEVYNNAMISASYEWVFSNNRESLLRYFQ